MKHNVHKSLPLLAEEQLQTLISSSPITPSHLYQLLRSIHHSSAALRLFDWCRLRGLQAASPSHAPFAFQAIFQLAARENKDGNFLPLKKLLLRSNEQGYALTPGSATLLVRSFAAARSPSDSLLAFQTLDPSLRCTDLCNHLLASLLRSPVPNHRAEALSLLRDMLSPISHCLPNSITCSILFFTLSRSGVPANDEILNLIIQITKFGAFAIDTYQFTKVVVGLCRDGRTGKAWDLIYAVKNGGGAVEVPVWNALLTGLSKDRDTSRMTLVFSDIEEAGAANVITYGIVMNHLCKSRNIDLALQMFDKMTKPFSAAGPDTVIFNNLIDGLCKVGRTCEGLALLDRMKTHHCDPNAITFNALIDGFCKSGDIDAAFELNARMVEEGVSPNIVTLNTLISGMCKNGMVSSALSFFCEKKMAWANARGNSVTYCTLIGAFLHANNVSKGMELFNEMIREGHSPDAVTYFTLISGLSMAGRIDDASSVASSMRKNGFQLDTKSYNILITGFGKKKKMEKALKLFHEMSEAGIKPDVVTYNTLIDAYCKAGDFSMAQTLLKQMMDDNCEPSLVTYGTLIHGFCKNGDRDGAVKIFQSLQDSKFEPNAAIYNVLIDSFCKSGGIGTAVSLLDQMRSSRVPPNIITYNAIMKGLCEKNMSAMAFELMEQMKEEGCDPDLTTMEILSGWLPAIGETERLRWFIAGNEAVVS
ncbi:pentatricopeptide repeat-containing protein At3g61520, mitochondrial-like [Phalaenopsis equestris]|uniref:pentatricopeptide repeat-containing protein At3g61520, mitochondrial-like n=1 Tax=Phalaenopsis equestris TaxID=78828 RepID=UPI0009E4E3EE|nr:pentatricopeptide repeat-containing protein At3g61520, mitochondrial-like [Phalaenopsis equestris]XP_020581449.1 pentatricopeptide repeat-containing protein At3g61520, mitochondrial-like [Phalaenopsis equestris]